MITIKKQYKAPEMKAYQVMPRSIISTSQNATSSTETLIEEDFEWN